MRKNSWLYLSCLSTQAKILPPLPLLAPDCGVGCRKWNFSVFLADPLQGRLFNVIDELCLPSLSTFSHRQLTSIVHAASRVRQEIGDDTFNAFVKYTILQMHNMSAQDAAKTVNALTVLRIRRPLATEIIDAASSQIYKVRYLGLAQGLL